MLVQRETQQETHLPSSLGRGENSYWKQDQIEKFLKRQLPILRKKGRGLIIDTHSGDSGETPHPQNGLFSCGSIKTTPFMAVNYARIYNADVILCEKNKECRSRLSALYENAEILSNNNLILDRISSIINYPWVVVISDPNGHGRNSGNCFDVLQEISKQVKVSDFIIILNIQSLIRHVAVAKNINNINHPMSHVRESAKMGLYYEWMLNDDEWKKRLSKRSIIYAGPEWLSGAMTAKVMLISNFIPGVK
jgi:hypothetical protein